ncbi:hypothetical protein KKA14_02630 [bacterium]|nr:hypothetical protein [bacterium]
MTNKTQGFSLKRIILLGKIALADDWRPFFLTGVIIGCLILFGGLFLNVPSADFLLNIMLLIGVVLVSRVFADVHEQEKGIYFFTLPASVDEKYLVKFIATLFGFFGFALLICFVATALSDLISSLLSSAIEFQIRDPFTVKLQDKFAQYLFFHSVFFSGSLYFKKSSFLKSAFSLIAVLILLAIGAATVLKNSFAQTQTSQFHLRFDSSQSLPADLQNYWFIAKIVGFVVVPILLYVLSYMKFRKIEIKG